jgi:hypothetical protein
MENDKLLEVLLEELREIRTSISKVDDKMDDMRKEFYAELEKTNKDVSTLKTRFMFVAITMGLAGGKISAVLPFLK